MARTPSRLLRTLGAAFSLLCGVSAPAGAAIDLADAPLFSSVTVPGNLALVLSVEYPTGIALAYPSTVAYASGSTFLGYFDPDKCYRYDLDQNNEDQSYFTPVGAASSHTCQSAKGSPRWSGNYLNWASMQTLDAFRWILTGGARGVKSGDDTATQTILEKSNVPAQGTHASNTPEKTLAQSSVTGATPFTWSSVVSRNWGTGAYMLVSTDATTLAKDGIPGSAVAYDGSYGRDAASGTIYRLYIRVKACVSGMTESNCVQYGSNAKPEGLMQKYKDKLRYAAFSYLNGDSSGSDGIIEKDGAVMRARMKFIGPSAPVPGSSALSNDNREWDADTGVMIQNPDPADATATGSVAGTTISYSGVMNYLNRFGKVVSYPAGKGYRHYDPVSELYYTALRYFRGLGNVESYTSLTSNVDSSFSKAQTLDGFPAITEWDDPMIWGVTSGGRVTKKTYACQKNFILGIGDVNTQYDANLPGWDGSPGSDSEPEMPPEVSSDPWASDSNLNVVSSTNMVGQLEGLGALGTMNQTSVNKSRVISSYGGHATNFIAGLAYAAHTTDLRSGEGFAGKQTVNTYWLDVQEYQYYVSKNIYWLATKYGGFEVASDFQPFAATNRSSTIPQRAWTNGDNLTNAYNAAISDKRPTNYFVGSDPGTMKSSLDAAFAKIVAEAGAATATALAAPSPKQTTSGSANYAASYDPSNWTGVLKGQSVVYDSDGDPSYTEAWNAASLLNARDWTTRYVISYCNGGVAFNSSMRCTASLAAVDGVATQSAANYISYLRGDRRQELANGGNYRSRRSLLGDIVNAKAVASGPPDALLSDLYNPGYSAFRRTYASRKTVVYAGANDGMLHAFDGSLTSADAGKELFAYIPGLIYSDTDAGTAGGLSSLGNPAFTHRFMVDATPNVFDVDFYRTSNPTASANDWRTVLIGGLGKGGKGYYAIDITDPASWSSEAEVAGKVLWEFGNSASNTSTTTTHLGYSYGDAMVIKTAKYGWVVVLTSGYNNDDGKGYFFFLNPRTGALLETVATTEGTSAEPLNLAKASAFVPDYKNGTADAIYAGDLRGNVWRLDIGASSGSYSAPVKIAQLQDPDGAAQPLTTRPLIEIEPDSSKRYVLLGTGRLLADSDIASAQVQSFYALIDGTSTPGAFYGGTTALPSGVAFPLSRTDLEENSNLVAGIGSSPERTMGWYFDLPVSAGVARRVNVDPSANNGIVALAGNLPNGEACAPSGTSRTYAVSLGLGKSALLGTNNTSVAELEQNSVVTDIAFVNVNGSIRLLAGTAAGNVVKVPGSYSAGNALRRMNWRVVPPVD